MTTTAARQDAGAATTTVGIATKSPNPSQQYSQQVSSWEGQDAYSEDHSSTECTGSTTAMPAQSPKVTLSDGHITLLMFQSEELTRRVDAIETRLSKHMQGLGENGPGITSEVDGHDGTLSVAMQLDNKLSVAMHDFVAFRRQLELQFKLTVQRQDMKLQKLVDAVQGLTVPVNNNGVANNEGEITPLIDTYETKGTQKLADATQGLKDLVHQINGVANKAGNLIPSTDTFGPKEARADNVNGDGTQKFADAMQGLKALVHQINGAANKAGNRIASNDTFGPKEARADNVNGDVCISVNQFDKANDALPSTLGFCNADQTILQAGAAPTRSSCPPVAPRTRSPRSPIRSAPVSHAVFLSEFNGKDREEIRGQKVNTAYAPMMRM